MRVVGFDPSMSNWGIAAGSFDGSLLKTDFLECITPAKAVEKARHIRVNATDLDRAGYLYHNTMMVLKQQKPGAVFVEVPVGSKSARAMASYGICIGLLAAIREAGYPFFIVTPTEVKVALTGAKSASKATIIAKAVERFPDAPWPRSTTGQIVQSRAEHAADAVGAILAGLASTPFKNFHKLALFA